LWLGHDTTDQKNEEDVQLHGDIADVLGDFVSTEAKDVAATQS
jgi:hypothetical protein